MTSAAPLIDWRLAESTALRLMPARPISAEEANEVVEGLRVAALEAEQPIADVTAMTPIVPKAQVRVVDRPTWARSNLLGLEVALAPISDVLRERRRANDDVEGADESAAEESARDSVGGVGGVSGRGSAVVTAIGSRATGFQLGSLLAFVGTKVLGQHELFAPAGSSPRLLLVAPNVVTAERSLGVEPWVFRRWVCLHEETHRVQLASAPWLRTHIEQELTRFFASAEFDLPLGERLSSLIGQIAAAVRGQTGSSLLDAVQTPEQRDILDRLVGLMSLLEGHADWAMDAVGEEVVPGLAEVRSRFEQRRKGGGGLDQVLRRLFSLDAKLAQYRDGAAFVRGVIELVGVEGLNAAFTSADTLPMREEIAEPRRWADRVHAGTAS
jgi:coenzyme F420 biosynthesis associated uncharacterized protein